MKHGKNPTRSEKQLISQNRLNPENWLVCKRHNNMLTLVHRETSSTRQIPMERW
ncbi:DUF6906 family protein [Heyndrickxia ginsengihumi]|uniref:DUF6906 family protein n=1 Tax=Heyndrickxia ginsengihumi TaxID=363870 RepID=UPI000B1A99D8|nr:hypothetical protein [Heyndrickxia ginsengihumi]